MVLVKLKIWYLLHKWSSLISTIFLLMLCITGLPLIFAHEIDHLLGRSAEPIDLETNDQIANLDMIIEDAKSRRPNDVVQFLVGDYDEPELWHIRFGEDLENTEASAFYTYDSRTGDFLNDYPLNTGFMDVMLRLHVDMYAGLPGTLFLGFMGVLLIISLISGVMLYKPFMSKLNFGTIRYNKSSFVKWLDLHNFIGIVTLVWLFVVTITGVVNTLSIPIFGYWQSDQLAEMIESHQSDEISTGNYSTENAVKSITTEYPDHHLSFMAYPGTNFSSNNHFVAFLQGKTAWSSKLLKPVLIDAKSGKIHDERELPLYVSLLLISQPLHFGDYAGLPLKIFWYCCNCSFDIWFVLMA